MFVALHDISGEMGPTHFYPKTHAPRCFPDERWLPPTESLAAERQPVWFEMKAGDAIIMDALTWHYGGANVSDSRRTLLSFTFVERLVRGAEAMERDSSVDRLPEAARSTLRLSDFVGP